MVCVQSPVLPSVKRFIAFRNRSYGHGHELQIENMETYRFVFGPMARLPDFEGLAIFAKVVEGRFFAGPAAELKLSKAAISNAISRIAARLGARLITAHPGGRLSDNGR
jgi:hypothetical protein